MKLSTPIDIKHSSHKNLTQFLKAAAQQGLIKTKEQKGDVVITHVFEDHPDVVAHILFGTTLGDVAKKEDIKKEKQELENSKPAEVVVTEMWKGIGNSHLRSFFKEVGKEYGTLPKDTNNMLTQTHSPGQLYVASDIRAMINSYITANSLPNPRNQALVRIDPLLNALLIGPKEAVGDLRREDILRRLCSKMQPWHSISQGERKSVR
jgi:translation initiation factor 2D